MKRAFLILLLASVVVAAVFAMERASAPKIGERMVVVELFTSQGCSSCPPADELLRRIARDPKLHGKVIPLAFHVDYWNSLGWRDPFSSRDWSARQRDYVRAMKLASAYTPQIIVNGTRQMVGSSSFEVYKAIEDESRRAAEGTVTLTPAPGGYIVRATSPHRDADLVVVTFENGATTHVTAGENNGKTLADDAIARKLVHAESGAKIDVDPKYGVVAFLQDRGTKRLWTAAVSAAGTTASRRRL